MLREPIHTERLLLRPVTVADAPRLHELMTWDIVRCLAVVPWPLELEDLTAYLAGAERDTREGRRVIYAIEFDGEACGVLSLSPRDGAMSLGYWLGENCRNRGIITEAAQAVLDAFFETYPDIHVISGVFEGNGASLRVQEKLGFAVVGETLRHSRALDRLLPYYDTVLGRMKWSQSLAA